MNKNRFWKIHTGKKISNYVLYRDQDKRKGKERIKNLGEAPRKKTRPEQQNRPTKTKNLH